MAFVALGEPYLCAKNSRYEVYLRRCPSPFGQMDWIMVKRHDRAPVRDWRDMQRIKDELLGPEREACELYPAQSRMVDMPTNITCGCCQRGSSSHLVLSSGPSPRRRSKAASSGPGPRTTDLLT